MKPLPPGECLVCSAPFQPTRPWHRFCSNRCRHEAWDSGEHPKVLAETACTYCGLPCDTIDHVPPRVARDWIVEFNLEKRYPFIEVAACRECNSALGAKPLWTVGQRKQFIKRYLKRKYAKYLKIPEWSDSEIARLGARMQQYVIQGLAMQEVANERIRY